MNRPCGRASSPAGTSRSAAAQLGSPALGGFLLEHTSWRAVYRIVLGVGALAGVVALALLPGRTGEPGAGNRNASSSPLPVYTLAADVMALTPLHTDDEWYVGVNGTVEYVLPRPDSDDWRRVVMALDGRRTLGEAVQEASAKLACAGHRPRRCPPGSPSRRAGRC
ncbi:hypothetical protein [Streptantibioticus silvisoli]|uniref:Uncharacterized protein n=1 Tax=Streptantibioticus silvisoli TaxID=2705255 RepID=A0ABT6VZA3_9ACTN|nr:hypothetical protein [Streptantibioticus silvisoli]MDI5963364.1 hypothetical protein [Streptantibioticus silvisoli]